MIENISKLRHILSKAQKRRVCGLGVMILISGLLETIGILRRKISTILSFFCWGWSSASLW